MAKSKASEDGPTDPWLRARPVPEDPARRPGKYIDRQAERYRRCRARLLHAPIFSENFRWRVPRPV